MNTKHNTKPDTEDGNKRKRDESSVSELEISLQDETNAQKSTRSKTDKQKQKKEKTS